VSADATELELGEEAPTALYRFYAADGSLLYVGVTNNMKARLGQHAADKPWWPQVARKTVGWHATRAEALAAESAAIKTEHPAHNIAGIEKSKPVTAGRPLHAVEDWEYEFPDDPFPDHWPPDHWGRIWWNSERSSNASQYEFLDIFGCPKSSAIEALGVWFSERRACRQGEGCDPVIWYQVDDAHPADPGFRPGYPLAYSIHADVTCVEPWEEFTSEAECVQAEFLQALMAAGYCRSVHPGRAAAAFGFAGQLEAQVAGTILGYLARGGTYVAIQSTEALLRAAAA
jgi:predicted GIY-YIG superfamily endonuclease